MKFLCEVLGKSKQAYYKDDGNRVVQEGMKEQVIVDYVRKIRLKDAALGGAKLWRMYQRDQPEEMRLGRDHFKRVLRENGLCIRRRRRKPRTTNSRHGLPLYPNLVRDLIPTGPNQVWVSDITYLEKGSDDEGGKFYYLALITDAYSHEIIGWDLSRTLNKEGALRALEKAFRRLNSQEQGLIHHSDRGLQYASLEYVKRLKKRGISISMTENGDPKENAVAERVNGIVKNELLKGKPLGTFEQVLEELNKAIRFYNQERPHMSCGMYTPMEAATMTGPLYKSWHSYREKAIEQNRARQTV